MRLLRTICYLLTLCGCWPPPLSSPFKKFAYNVYHYYAFLVVNVAMFCEVMDLVLNVENEDEFCDNIYITMGMGIGCHKMCSAFFSRKNIIVMVDMLESEPFRPETEEEIKIRNRCMKQTECDSLRSSNRINGDVRHNRRIL
ncbi:uncharacterized protein LOC143426780 [Xylocopa sonorina]|uniref:uncharacterized protein LOC143426780 n=1 Tax=Xylocopa sonorina TaxID=1818115 RepID=UPI00403AB68F